MIEVQPGLDLLLVLQRARNCTMYVAHGHREPVATGLLHKAPRLLDVGEAATRIEELLIGGWRSCLVA